MKKTTRFLPVLALILLMSCGSSNVTAKKYTDVDFNNFKTFAYAPSASSSIDGSDNSTEASLISVLNTKMIEKGFSMTEENPDLTVRLLGSDEINSNEDTKGIYERASGGGSTPNYSSSGSSSNNRFSSGANDNDSNNNPYKKGSLVVEVFDGKTNELLWAGTAKNFKSHIADQTLMATMLNGIFQKFPK